MFQAMAHQADSRCFMQNMHDKTINRSNTAWTAVLADNTDPVVTLHSNNRMLMFHSVLRCACAQQLYSPGPFQEQTKHPPKTHVADA